VDKQYSDIHHTNFQPRIGAAYSLNDKTVVCAGAGRFLTRLRSQRLVFLGGNPPFQPIVSISNGLSTILAAEPRENSRRTSLLRTASSQPGSLDLECDVPA
jgi:hypothetical protein